MAPQRVRRLYLSDSNVARHLTREALCNDDDVDDFKRVGIDDGYAVVTQHDVFVASVVGDDHDDVFWNRIEVNRTRKATPTLTDTLRLRAGSTWCREKTVFTRVFCSLVTFVTDPLCSDRPSLPSLAPVEELERKCSSREFFVISNDGRMSLRSSRCDRSSCCRVRRHSLRCGRYLSHGLKYFLHYDLRLYRRGRAHFANDARYFCRQI